MSSTTYELRSVRGNRPVFSFDDIVRAKQEQARAQERGVRLSLVRVTRTEEVIAA